jgi:hypothetical protein
MTIDELRATLAASAPPHDVSALVRALWHDARGDWDTAHRIAQDIESEDAAWVHAYLHRREGDAGNAAYWYRRAGKPVSRAALDDEWNEIAAALLER